MSYRCTCKLVKKRAQLIRLHSVQDLERFHLNASGFLRVHLGLDKKSGCDTVAMDMDSGVSTTLYLYNRRIGMTNLMSNLAATFVACKTLLKEKVWNNAIAALMVVIARETVAESEVRQAVKAAMPAAYEKSHWQQLLDVLKAHIGLLCLMRNEFVRGCDPEVLAEFLAGAGGFVDSTFIGFVGADGPVVQEETDKVHFCLNGLERLAGIDRQWVSPLLEAVEVLGSSCEIRGGYVEGLQKRLQGIQTEFPRTLLAVPEPVVQPQAKTTVPPARQQKQYPQSSVPEGRPQSKQKRPPFNGTMAVAMTNALQ